jgi:hypothetical protein
VHVREALCALPDGESHWPDYSGGMSCAAAQLPGKKDSPQALQ